MFDSISSEDDIVVQFLMAGLFADGKQSDDKKTLRYIDIPLNFKVGEVMGPMTAPCSLDNGRSEFDIPDTD